jgi:hypothetical protein
MRYCLQYRLLSSRCSISLRLGYVHEQHVCCSNVITLQILPQLLQSMYRQRLVVVLFKDHHNARLFREV